MDSEERIACRRPGEGRDGATRIPAWKFRALRRAILHAVEGAGSGGLPLAELTGAVRARLSEDELRRLGSLGWHCTTVRLELEVAGELARAAHPGAQRLMRGSGEAG